MLSAYDQSVIHAGVRSERHRGRGRGRRTSKRPGRSSASSMRSLRFVMPRSSTLSRGVTPSMIESSWLTSESYTRPADWSVWPRLRQMASSSSKMMICSLDAPPLLFCSASAADRDQSDSLAIGRIRGGGSHLADVSMHAAQACKRHLLGHRRAKEVAEVLLALAEEFGDKGGPVHDRRAFRGHVEQVSNLARRQALAGARRPVQQRTADDLQPECRASGRRHEARHHDAPEELAQLGVESSDAYL